MSDNVEPDHIQRIDAVDFRELDRRRLNFGQLWDLGMMERPRESPFQKYDPHTMGHLYVWHMTAIRSESGEEAVDVLWRNLEHLRMDLRKMDPWPARSALKGVMCALEARLPDREVSNGEGGHRSEECSFDEWFARSAPPCPPF